MLYLCSRFTGIAQLVEHWSPKPGVGSSSLSSRASLPFILHHGADDALEEGSVCLSPLYDGVIHDALVNVVRAQGAAVLHVQEDFKFFIGTYLLDAVDAQGHAALVGFCQGNECSESCFVHKVVF